MENYATLNLRVGCRHLQNVVPSIYQILTDIPEISNVKSLK